MIVRRTDAWGSASKTARQDALPAVGLMRSRGPRRALRGVILAAAAAAIVGCGAGESYSQKIDSYNAYMAKWNLCRKSVTWQTPKQLYALCGPLGTVPSP